MVAVQSVLDASTVDLARTKIRLRDDVTFCPQLHGDELFYHIELPSKSQYYRIGYVEYVFLSLLDGRTTFSEALALTARTQGATAFSQEQALSLYQWMLETKLAVFTDGGPQSSDEKSSQNKAGGFLQKLNPFWIRIPFGRPDAMLQTLRPIVGWMFSPTATLLGVCLMVAAVARLMMNWNQFQLASGSVFSPSNWLWLLLAWILLKVTHETAHGIVCQRYGGSVRETGVILAFFAPLAYVDVSSCWRFSSCWQRIHVAAAGMYVELLLASVAVFSFGVVDSGVASHLLYNVIVMASVSTLLFNANPLMRFDGYYILSDVLGIPNLYIRSSEAVSQLLQRILVGQKSTAPTISGRQTAVLRCYGMAAVVWRLLICATMLIAASVMFHGAGVALAVAGTLAWFGMPVWNAMKQLRRIAQASPLRLVRAGFITLSFCAMLAGCLFGLPVPFSTTAPGVVSLPEGCRVHTEVNGFIQTLHVADGQHVEAGDLLMTLRNEDITNRHRDLELQIQQEVTRQQIAMKDHDAGAASVANSNLKSLRQRLVETLDQYNALQIRAPVTGQVVAPRLVSRQQTYVREGESLLVVDDGQSRELRMSVAQDDFSLAEQQVGEVVNVRIGTRPTVSGTIERVIPRASRHLIDQSLAATEGGSLAVVAGNDDAGNDDAEEEVQLTEQRFEAIVRLDASGLDLPIGERAYAPLGTLHESLASHLYDRSTTWFRTQIENAQRDMSN